MIYVLALYQFYTLLSFSEAIEKRLPIKAENYLDYSPILMDEINTITVKLNIFLARNTYSVVSYIQHHNDFYKYIIKQLHIEENISRLSIGIDSLGKLEKTLEKEKEEQKKFFFGKRFVYRFCISSYIGMERYRRIFKFDEYKMFMG